MIKRKGNVYKLDTPSSTLLIRAEEEAEILYYGDRLFTPGSDYERLFSPKGEEKPLFSCGEKGFVCCFPEGKELVSRFFLQRAKLTEKPVVSTLPYSFCPADDKNCRTLCLEFSEPEAKLKLFVYCTAFDDCDAVVFSSRLVNGGKKPVSVRRLDSFALFLPGGEWEPGEGIFPSFAVQKGGTYAFIPLLAGEGGRAERRDGIVRIGCGDFCPEILLSPGEELVSPETAAAFARDREEAARALRGFFARRVLRGRWKGKKRPVAAECGLDEAAAWEKAGAEILLFAARPDEAESMEKLVSVSEEVRGRGLRTGLCIRPGLALPKDAVLRRHPEYVLRRTPEGSLLDLSDPQVRKYLVRTISSALTATRASCVQWQAEEMPASRFRYAEGLCAVLSRLAEKFPSVLFEGTLPLPGMFAFFRGFRTETPLPDPAFARGVLPQDTRSLRLRPQNFGALPAFGSPGFFGGPPDGEDGREIGKFLARRERERKAAECGELYSLGGTAEGLCAVSENRSLAAGYVRLGDGDGRVVVPGLDRGALYVVRNGRDEGGERSFRATGELLGGAGFPLRALFGDEDGTEGFFTAEKAGRKPAAAESGAGL